jgi:Phage integrase family
MVNPGWLKADLRAAAYGGRHRPLSGRTPTLVEFAVPSACHVTADCWSAVPAACDPLLEAVDLHGAHDFRHTYATWLEDAGIPARVIDELMGHEATGRSGQHRGSARAPTTGTPPRRWPPGSSTPSSNDWWSCSRWPKGRLRTTRTGQRSECSDGASPRAWKRSGNVRADCLL